MTVTKANLTDDPLCQNITEKCVHCKMIVLTVGSLGSVYWLIFGSLSSVHWLTVG